MSTYMRAAAMAGMAVLLAGALSACGSSSSNSGNKASNTSASSSKGSSGGTVAFIPGATGVGFYNSMKSGAQAEAQKLGYKFVYQGSPDFTPTAQTPIVNAVCGNKPKILLIAPTDPVALRPAIQNCLNDGIKVVTVDTNLKDTSDLVSAVTSDNIQGGAAAADLVGSKLHGHGQVAVMSLDPTTTTQVLRIKGFTQELAKKYPGIKVVATEYTGQPETVSESKAKAVLSAHPDVKAFFGAAEPNCDGVAQVIKGMGKQGQILNIGYDADPSETALLQSGDITALVIQKPATEGQLGVQYGHDALTGKTSSIKKSVKLPNVLVTTANSKNPKYTKYYYAAS